jgi:hypothetical protein
MWQVALNIFTVVTTILALAYAHHAHRQSVHAPILRVALSNPVDGSYIEAPKEPIDITLRINRHGPISSLEVQDSEVRGFPLPVVIRNLGTKTAQGIILRARYSAFLKVVSHGQPVEDVDRKEWIVIDHSIPDLNPKQAHRFSGDLLLPTETLIHGVTVDTVVTTKDRKKVRVKARAEGAAIIEILVYSADAEPVFLFCKVKVKKDDAEPVSRG